MAGGHGNVAYRDATVQIGGVNRVMNGWGTDDGAQIGTSYLAP